MKTPFSETLKHLRKQANLTSVELAELSDVPRSLISGLENNTRRVGELQAVRLAKALGLCGPDLEQFIYQAVNTCTERVLAESKEYPAELINFVTHRLRQAGILPEQVNDCEIGSASVRLVLNNGKHATVEAKLAYA